MRLERLDIPESALAVKADYHDRPEKEVVKLIKQFIEKLSERKVVEEKRPRFIERFAVVPARYGFR